MNDITTTILKSINSVIAGKEAVVEKVLMAILSGGHVLLEDVPGVGKTTLAISFARTLGLGYPPRAVHVGHHALGHSGLFRL